MLKRYIRSLLIGMLFFQPALAQKKLNVLFVGNSLTYSNDLPAILQKIGVSDNLNITYKTIAYPNYALEDHWVDGKVQQELKTSTYDIMLVQQGPSSQAEGRGLLLEYGLKLAALAKENNTRIASYMVWPPKSRMGDFDGVTKSYRLLADSAKGVFCPVGNAWLQLWKKYPDFALYDTDNFHPNYNGSLLAALVIYASITGKQSLGFAAYSQFKNSGLTATQFNQLVEAAESILKGN